MPLSQAPRPSQWRPTKSLDSAHCGRAAAHTMARGTTVPHSHAHSCTPRPADWAAGHRVRPRELSRASSIRVLVCSGTPHCRRPRGSKQTVSRQRVGLCLSSVRRRIRAAAPGTQGRTPDGWMQSMLVPKRSESSPPHECARTVLMPMLHGPHSEQRRTGACANRATARDAPRFYDGAPPFTIRHRSRSCRKLCVKTWQTVSLLALNV